MFCHEAGETIRQTAERNARQLFVKIATTKGQPDDVTQLYFVGNCPAGWFWRTAKEDQWSQQGNFGDKVVLDDRRPPSFHSYKSCRVAGRFLDYEDNWFSRFDDIIQPD